MKKFNLIIDNKKIKVRKGMTILEACQDADIYIPTLCYHEELIPYGGCRLCIVKVKGIRGFLTACTTPVEDGMVIQTNTREIQKLRRNDLELILSEHPYSCLVCSQKDKCEDYQGTIRKVGVTTGCQFCSRNGDCELQKIMDYLKLKDVRFPIDYKSRPVENYDPFFDRDYNLCVLCGKCVRVCEEIRGRGAIALTYRGSETIVSTAFGKSHLESGCAFCGACIEVCPTGALSERETKWEPEPSHWTTTICPYCGVGCSIKLGINNGKIVRVSSDYGVVNKGQTCVKGKFGIREMVYSEKRLTAPLIRGEKATWDEALDYVVDNLVKYKKDTFALISSPNCTNEDSYVFQKFTRAVMNSNNIDNLYRTYLNPTITALNQVFGKTPPIKNITDISRASTIVVIGTNTHPIMRIEVRKAVRRGAKLITIDVRETELAHLSDIWLQPHPESDGTLLIGIISAMLKEKLITKRKRGINYDNFERYIHAVDLKYVGRKTGVSEKVIRETARLFAQGRRGIILYGTGVTQYPSGVQNVLTIADLALLTGSGIIPVIGENNAQGACDMGCLPQYLPGYQSVDNDDVRGKFEKVWDCSLNSKPGLTKPGILKAIKSGKIKSLYLIGEVLNLDFLKDLELLIVQSVFPSEIIEFADVVLPASGFAEIEGTYTNTEGRVQRLHKVIDPIGDTKPDWSIVCQIARRLGVNGFDFKNPKEIMKEIATLIPYYSKMGKGEKKRAKPRFVIPTFKKKASKDSKKYPFPFRLIAEYNLFTYRGGSLVEQITGMRSVKDDEVVEINSKDAASKRIAEGDSIQISFPDHSTITRKARLIEGLPRGIIYVLAKNIPLSESKSSQVKIKKVKNV